MFYLVIQPNKQSDVAGETETETQESRVTP